MPAIEPPTGTLIHTQEGIVALRRLGAYSVPKAIAAGTIPPMPSPASTRKLMSSVTVVAKA